jgi:hypothetical protein
MNRASYIGGNFGGGRAHQEFTLTGTEPTPFGPATFGSPDSGNASGILGGGQIGFGGPSGAMGY